MVLPTQTRYVALHPRPIKMQTATLKTAKTCTYRVCRFRLQAAESKIKSQNLE